MRAPGLSAAAALAALFARAQGAASAEPARPEVSLKASVDRRTGLAEVPVPAFVAAVARGDRAEIGRAAERLGPARLAALLGGPDKGAALAALEGVRVLHGHARLLGAVTPLCADADGRVAERAVAVTGELLRADDPAELETWEVPADQVAAACDALARAGSAATGGLPVRLAALEALAEAHLVCDRPAVLAAAADDVWPEVRRAALLAPQLPRVRSIDAVGDVTGDPVPKVAGAAAALWCRTREESLRKTAPSQADARRLARLGSLLLVDATPVEDALDALPCLALARDAEGRRAFEVLSKRTGTPLGDRARELADSTAGGPAAR